MKPQQQIKRNRMAFQKNYIGLTRAGRTFLSLPCSESRYWSCFMRTSITARHQCTSWWMGIKIYCTSYPTLQEFQPTNQNHCDYQIMKSWVLGLVIDNLVTIEEAVTKLSVCGPSLHSLVVIGSRVSKELCHTNGVKEGWHSVSQK